MILRLSHKIAGFVTTVRAMLGLVWQTQPAYFAGTLMLDLVQGTVPMASAWLTKVLIDLLAQTIQNPAAPLPLQTLILVLIGQTIVLIVSQVGAPVHTYMDAELGRRLTLNIQTHIYRKINSLVGVAPLEDPRFHTTIQLAAQSAYYGPDRALSTFMMVLRNSVTLVAFLGLLVSFSPLLAGMVILAVIPQLYIEVKLGQQRMELALHNSPQERRASYYGTVLSGVQYAKEIRLFNLAEYFLQAFKTIMRQIHETQRAQQVRALRWQSLLASGASIVAGIAFALVVFQAAAGHLTLGAVTFYLSAVTSVQGSLASMIFAFATLYESVLFYKRFTDLLAIEQPLVLANPPKPIPPLKSGIHLRNVSFRYSPQQPWVLRHLELFIPAGQCLALVGANGAGKTTLVKLLTRLYDPTEGMILWDGIDIRNFDPQEFRQCIGPIFQDFIRYDLTVQENIGLGDVTRIADAGAIREAAVQAGIHEAIEQLPRGYQTVISRWLAGDMEGIDLSGGEWQKIGLARMFMRKANLCILDEPTAALDAQSEYDLYQRFVALIAKQTSLLISHRLSTVRMADLIAVLEDGRISEYGNHHNLIASGGHYAYLYSLQASQYQGTDDPAPIDDDVLAHE